MDCKKHVSSNSTFIKVDESSMYRGMGLAPAQTCKAPIWAWRRLHTPVTGPQVLKRSMLCKTRHDYTAPQPRYENLGKQLRIFSGKCTLSNCIFQSFSLKCCFCEFAPLLKWKNKFYRCNLIYTTGQDDISFLMSAISRYAVIRDNV